MKPFPCARRRKKSPRVRRPAAIANEKKNPAYDTRDEMGLSVFRCRFFRFRSDFSDIFFFFLRPSHERNRQSSKQQHHIRTRISFSATPLTTRYDDKPSGSFNDFNASSNNYTLGRSRYCYCCCRDITYGLLRRARMRNVIRF